MDYTPILVIVLVLAIFALLAQGYGVDSRDWDTEGEHRSWL